MGVRLPLPAPNKSSSHLLRRAFVIGDTRYSSSEELSDESRRYRNFIQSSSQLRHVVRERCASLEQESLIASSSCPMSDTRGEPCTGVVTRPRTALSFR